MGGGADQKPTAVGDADGEFCIMDRKPIITFAGDKALFSSLEANLTQAIPQEATEWRRSYGRPIKPVYTEASFTPFDREKLPKEGDWNIIRQPIFHIYWTECVDVDLYKTNIREDIDIWLKVLQKHGIEDWLIVQVETYDIKRSNKLLPRTTVHDKIRSDFASKHPDRCISVINPIRSESKSAETWRGLLHRIRLLLLQAYDTTLVRFEETIRKQRERRIEPGWSFCKYFLLQEELAFVLEMLGLYDEAIIQYDELDALFTQFVLNSRQGETPNWLGSFQGALETWPGLQLTHKVDQEQRLLIKRCEASLLQFRSYLFSRQCAMLLLTFQPWEIAKRTLPFLHNCVAELRILEVPCPPGAVACWIFLGCLEVLRTCERFNDSIQVQKYSRFTASLWAYSSEKLNELGELCGLLPGMDPTSEQLHLVVGLSAGMGDAPESSEPTPTDQLKEALSSKEAFIKHYLEFAELAMGTYKHIGHVRFARLIGRRLAVFHQRIGDYQTACLFLDAALQMVQSEGWRQLAVETRQELAECYLKMDDKEKFVSMCASLASSEELSISERENYLSQMIETFKDLNIESPLVTDFSEAINLLSVEVRTEKTRLVVGGTVEVAVELISLLPSPMQCDHAALSVEKCKVKEENSNSPNNSKTRGSTSPQHSHTSNDSAISRGCIVDTKAENPLVSKVSLCQSLDYQQDKSLKAAWVTCPDPRYFLRRADSQGNHRKNTTNVLVDFSSAVTAGNFLLQPGKNLLILRSKVTEPGCMRFGQMSLKLCDGRLELLSTALRPLTGFEVVSESTKVSILQGKPDLVAGLEQEVTLIVNTGSKWIREDSKLLLKASDGLRTQLKAVPEEPLLQELEVTVPLSEPFQTVEVFLRVFASLKPQKDTSTMEHQLKLQCLWSQEREPISLQFQPPFFTTLRLHTSHRRKFAQVVVTGLNSVEFLLRDFKLVSCMADPEVQFQSLNPSGGRPQVIGNGINVYLLWELDVGDEIEENPKSFEATFTMLYEPVGVHDNNARLYQCNFDITDFKTLIVTNARVEPPKGSEFCRASSMCHLHLTVERVSQSLRSSLMYEVLVDQTMWAVCGRTTGVVTLDEGNKQSVTLDVMPLISGYLPIPLVRLSKYIPADQKPLHKASTVQPRREPFSPGQVFNNSKAQQIHILPAVSPGDSP